MTDTFEVARAALHTQPRAAAEPLPKDAPIPSVAELRELLTPNVEVTGKPGTPGLSG